MKAQSIIVRTCEDELTANHIAQALTDDYHSLMHITVAQVDGPKWNVIVERRNGKRLSLAWVQALTSFARGAEVASKISVRLGATDAAPPNAGCEFCRPTDGGDPFTNRPQGEVFVCPYCHAQFTGKETE